MSDLASFKSFPIGASTLILWVFKKRIDAETKSPIFTAKWVAVDDGLGSEIKSALVASLQEITELIDYSLLAQNNEGSALSLSIEGTHAAQILLKASAETQNNKIIDERNLLNAAFYSIKLIHQDNVLFAINEDGFLLEDKEKTRHHLLSYERFNANGGIDGDLQHLQDFRHVYFQ